MFVGLDSVPSGFRAKCIGLFAEIVRTWFLSELLRLAIARCQKKG